MDTGINLAPDNAANAGRESAESVYLVRDVL